MHHIFITDPFSLLIPHHDSSLALMREAILLGSNVWQAEPKDISWNGHTVEIKASAVQFKDNKLTLDESQIVFQEWADQIVWVRKDPPVDELYTRMCQLLRLLKVPVLNNPDYLLGCEEKLFALEFPQLGPKTYIEQDIVKIRKMVHEKHKLIAKPVGGKGGEGILLLNSEDKNMGSLLELLTNYGQKKIVLQEYLDNVQTAGDKRIFLLAGEPLGAVLRLPNKEEIRANMAAGGDVVKTEITETEKQICQTIKSRLLELGLYIVGIDVIDGKLTEINITSPTCLEEIATFDQTNPAKEIVEWSEKYFCDS